MDRNTSRALDRWLTDDRNDYGPADAPDPSPTPDAAVIDAAHRNALATRRAALAARLLQSIGPSWDDIELAVWAFDRHRESRTAERLSELLIDLIDDAL
jgi:hypothetical protein